MTLVSGLFALLMIAANLLIYRQHRARSQGARHYATRSTFELSLLTRLFGRVKGLLYATILGHVSYQVWVARAPVPIARAVLGGALGVSGTLLLKWSLSALGSNFAPCDRGLVPEQRVHDGPYRFCRHPIYLANVLQLLAQSVLFPGWLAYTVVVMTILFYASAIRDEERAWS